MVKITPENFASEVLQAGVPVVADFYSDSCQPCKRLAVVLAELEEENEGMFKFCKVNVGANPELAEALGVMAAPTLIFFKGGAEVRRKIGFVDKKTLEDILREVSK